MKKTLIILLTISLTNLFAQIPTNGLVGYYPLNGNVNDLSGNGYNGTISGTPILTNDRFNTPNSAYYLDGTSLINVYGSQFNLNQATYSFWALVTTLPSTYFHIIGKTDACIGASGQCDRNGITIGIGSDGTTSTVFSWSQFPVNGVSVAETVNKTSKNQWVHYLVSYQLGGSLNYYRNGVFVGSVSGMPNSLTWTNNPLTFGSSNGGYYPNFTGIIDDVKIYNRILNQSEISSLYCENLTVYPALSLTGSGFQVNTINGFSYQWYKDNSTFSGGSNGLLTFPISNGSYKVGYKGCPLMSQTFTIPTNTLPITITSAPITVTSTNTVTVTSTPITITSPPVTVTSLNVITVTSVVTVTSTPLTITSTAMLNTCNTTTTGIDNKIVKSSITIYPNPAQIKFMISDNNLNLNTISIFKLDGSLVFTKSLTSNEIDISTLSNGNYFIVLSNADGLKVKSDILIKQ